MQDFLTTKFGDADMIITGRGAISGKKGIVLFDCTGAWGDDATGHVTLWNGSSFIRNDSYFSEAKSVLFWELPD